MKTKVLQVFYNENGLPFKDQERTVHFPIVGSGFMGASNTTQIKFYFKEIGNDAVKYVAVSKLPNGEVGSKVLENYYDSQLDEPYALLELDSYYTQYKGDLFISLQGYQGGVQVTYNEDTELYEIEGTPTIQATGSIKFTNNYATQFVGSGEEQNVTLQQLLAIISETVLRYNVEYSNTLAEVFNEIGTKICVLNVEGDEYLCEMSDVGRIALYDIYNQEWYAFTGLGTNVINDVLQDSNKQIVATKEDLENFGNLFTYKGAASVSEINALTDIGNGWCYNLTDSGTLTLGNLQVEQGDNVAFNGTIWTKLSSETVLGNYYTKQEGQAFETQIDNRVDAIENQVQQVASGSPKGAYATLAALQAAYPTGAEGIYVVSADGHWYYWSGSAWTDGGVYQSAVGVVPDTRTIDNVKLDHDIQANELVGLVQALKHSWFNPNDEDIVLDKYLNRETGAMTTATGYNFVISGFIPIKNGDTIRWTKGANIGARYSYAYYDEDKQFTTSNFDPSTSYDEYFELTVNNSIAKYIRITMRSTVKGDFTGLQCLINENWVNGVVYNYIGSNGVLDNILDKEITPNYLSCVDKLTVKNLFNKEAPGIKDNYYLDQSGNEVASDNFAISDFIEINVNSFYSVSLSSIVNNNYAGCYYDENKQFIANAPVLGYSFEDTEIKCYGLSSAIPSNAKYIRTNIAKTNVSLSEYMFIENTFSLTYIPYNIADYKANDQVDFLSDNAKQTLLDNSKRELLGNYNFLYKSKMIAFGDSICAGAGWAGGYPKIIGDKYEMTYSNEARSGSTITPNMKIGLSSPVGCITERFVAINPQMQYDYLLLEGGINDWNCSQGAYSQHNPEFVFGTYNMKDYDTTHLVDTTFCGSFEKLLSSALAKYQNTKIIFIIVHKYATIYNENDADYNTVKDWYNYWIPAIKDMCNKWGIAVVDLNKNCPPFNFVTAYKNAYTSSTSDGQGNPDGIHPNENGYKYYYVPEIIRKMVKWIKND